MQFSSINIFTHFCSAKLNQNSSSCYLALPLIFSCYPIIYLCHIHAGLQHKYLPRLPLRTRTLSTLHVLLHGAYHITDCRDKISTRIIGKQISECKAQTKMNYNENYTYRHRWFNIFLIWFLIMINIKTSVISINNNLKYRHQAAISYTSMFYISDNDVC